jgi:hypothetical protein
MKRLLSIFSVLLLVLSACQKTGGNDKDWNLSFYDNCGMPSMDSVEWIKEGDNEFIRFQLRDKDYGRCSTDGTARHSAPYWERAELKQSSFLSQNKEYELEFKVRFVEGFFGDRETFWQIHAYNSPCHAAPPVMLKISRGELILATLRPERKGHKVHHSNLKIGNLIGKWSTFKLKFDTGEKPRISIFIDNNEVFSEKSFRIEACGKPHFKFGIYRPGNVAGKYRSVVDFDKIRLTPQ